MNGQRGTVPCLPMTPCRRMRLISQSSDAQLGCRTCGKLFEFNASLTIRDLEITHSP